MNIQGYAFTEGWQEKSKENIDRYNEIQHLNSHITMRKTPQYGKTAFSGTLNTPEAMALSEKDIALIADWGNLCFGGNCTKSGDKFNGYYYID